MIRYASKIFYILEGRKTALFLLALLFFLTSFIEALGVSLIGTFISLATNSDSISQKPWLQWTYQRLGASSEHEFILLFSAATIVIIYFKSFLGFNVQKRIFAFGFGQEAALRVKLTRAYLKIPYNFYLSRNTSTIIQNIIVEASEFANGVLMPLLFVTSNLIVIAALLVLLISTSVVATASILFVLLITFAVFYRLKDKIASWGKAGSQSSAEMIRVINHGLGGLKETRVIGCESYFQQQMAEQAKVFEKAKSNFNAFSLLPRYAIESLLFTFIIGFAVFSIISNQSSENLTSTLGIFGIAAVRILPAISTSVTGLGNIRRNSYVVEKLYLDLKVLEKAQAETAARYLTYGSQYCSDEVCPGSGHEKKAFEENGAVEKSRVVEKNRSKQVNSRALPFEDRVSLNAITYCYPNASTPALKDISLVLNKGESIGLIGKSGAGKTTLVDVVLGLLEPNKGEISVDGVSVENDIRSWQNLVGYIPQSIFLIDDTIERNIAFGVPDCEIEAARLEKAIFSAQLTELIRDLPDGIKTVVGERGVRLSGGQRQRIGIARALYHEREILVLDEATAALDDETESLVTESITSLSGQKTMIMIAHRLSTLKDCDRIYLLDNGRVVKSGSYEDIVVKQMLS